MTAAATRPTHTLAHTLAPPPPAPAREQPTRPRRSSATSAASRPSGKHPATAWTAKPPPRRTRRHVPGSLPSPRSTASAPRRTGSAISSPSSNGTPARPSFWWDRTWTASRRPESTTAPTASPQPSTPVAGWRTGQRPERPTAVPRPARPNTTLQIQPRRR